MSDEQKIEEMMARVRHSRYMCAVCWQGMDTQDQKIKHMETAHGYTTLEITPISSSSST